MPKLNVNETRSIAAAVACKTQQPTVPSKTIKKIEQCFRTIYCVGNRASDWSRAKRDVQEARALVRALPNHWCAKTSLSRVLNALDSEISTGIALQKFARQPGNISVSRDGRDVTDEWTGYNPDKESSPPSYEDAVNPPKYDE